MAELNQQTAELLRLMGAGSYSETSLQAKDHTLYDTIPFVVATAISGAVPFFTVPYGSAQLGLTKTEVETNMSEQGKLPAGQNMVVNTISFSHIRNNDAGEITDAKTAAMARIMQGSRVRVLLAGRQFDAEIPGAKFLPPIMDRAYNAAASSVSSVGDFTGPNQIVLKTPIPLTNIQGAPVNFRLEWLINTSDAAVSAALSVLAAAGANGADRMQFRLGGLLVNPL
jgi:hypothetical protein